MKKASLVMIRLGIVLALAIAGCVQLPGQGRGLPLVSKILINGEVTIIIGASGNATISPYFYIAMDGKPLSGLDVILEGHRLNETSAGQYAGVSITDVVPAAGKTLKFLIKQHGLLTNPLTLFQDSGIAGTAVIGSMAAISQPVSGSSLNVSSLGKSLTVAWMGGAPPFKLSLLKPSGSAVLEVFSQSGIMASNFLLNTVLLQPSLQYQVGVSFNMGAFTLGPAGKELKIAIDPASAVKLRYTVFSTFSTN